jgi:hypothetical protein
VFSFSGHRVGRGRIHGCIEDRTTGVLWHIAPHAIPSDAPVDVKLADIFSILDAAVSAKNAFAYLRSDGRIAGDGDERDSRLRTH